MEDLAKECYFLQEDSDDPLTRSLAQNPEDSKYVGRSDCSSWLTLDSALITDALASLAAITLDRCVSFEKEIQIEQAHQRASVSARRGPRFACTRREDTSDRHSDGKFGICAKLVL